MGFKGVLGICMHIQGLGFKGLEGCIGICKYLYMYII